MIFINDKCNWDECTEAKCIEREKALGQFLTELEKSNWFLVKTWLVRLSFIRNVWQPKDWSKLKQKIFCRKRNEKNEMKKERKRLHLPWMENLERQNMICKHSLTMKKGEKGKKKNKCHENVYKEWRNLTSKPTS